MPYSKFHFRRKRRCNIKCEPEVLRCILFSPKWLETKLSLMASMISVLLSGGALIGGVSVYAFLKGGDFTLHRVEGPSMRPTLNCGCGKCGSYFSDILAVKKISKKEMECINISSILCIKHPKPERGYLVKRLVANQNEKIVIQTHYQNETDCTAKVIPKGHCWVQSDAGPGYVDSNHYLGPIPYEKIVGKALYIIWPPHRIKKL